MKRLKKAEKSKPKPKKEKNVETPDGLKSLLEEYQKKVIQLEFKVKRLRDLLSRKSALKLSKNKFEKMKKQLSEAEEDCAFSQHAIDQISYRISQIS